MRNKRLLFESLLIVDWYILTASRLDGRINVLGSFVLAQSVKHFAPSGQMMYLTCSEFH